MVFSRIIGDPKVFCLICCEFCILIVDDLLKLFVGQVFSLHSAGREQSASFTNLILALGTKDRTFPIIPLRPGANLPAYANSSNSPRRRSTRTRVTFNMSSSMHEDLSCLLNFCCTTLFYMLLTSFFFLGRNFRILAYCSNFEF